MTEYPVSNKCKYCGKDLNVNSEEYVVVYLVAWPPDGFYHLKCYERDIISRSECKGPVKK